MSEAGWLSIGTLVFGALSTGVGFIFKALLSAKDTLISRQEAEIAAYRTKIDQLQDKLAAQVQAAMDDLKKRAETDAVVARSIAEQSTTIKALSEKVTPNETAPAARRAG